MYYSCAWGVLTPLNRPFFDPHVDWIAWSRELILAAFFGEGDIDRSPPAKWGPTVAKGIHHCAYWIILLSRFHSPIAMSCLHIVTAKEMRISILVPRATCHIARTYFYAPWTFLFWNSLWAVHRRCVWNAHLPSPLVALENSYYIQKSGWNCVPPDPHVGLIAEVIPIIGIMAFACYTKRCFCFLLALCSSSTF